MDALKITRLVAELGHTYDRLIADNLISNMPIDPSIENSENEYLVQRPEPGVELWFSAQTKTLEKILFSLINMVEGASVYTGDLPSPFTIKMSRLNVREILGTPFESTEPVKILRSRGYGGGDSYLLDGASHLQKRIGFQYRSDDSVCSMGFSLVRRRL
jgi:hypothetical protein